MILPIFTMLSAATLVANTAPFSLDSRVPIGISLEQRVFITVEHEQKDKETTVHIRGYRPPRGAKFRVPLRSFSIDRTDIETETRTTETAEPYKNKANTWFETHDIQAAYSLAGGLTGRFRILEHGIVVAQQEDKVVVRRGDASVMKSKVLIKSLSKAVKRCRGKAVGKVKHVVFKKDWNALAIYIEATCTPKSEKRPFRRVSRLFVYDFQKLLGKK